jgi:hypothetical protein
MTLLKFKNAPLKKIVLIDTHMGFLMVCFNPWDFFKYPTPRCSTFDGLAMYIILTMDIAWEIGHN